MRYSRREFVRTAAAAGGALALGGSATGVLGQDVEPKPIPRRRFERIDLEVPIFCQGTGNVTEPAVMLRALEWGMDLVHTADHYAGGQTVRTMRDVLRGRRDKFILGFKTNLGEGHLEKNLEIMGTDHAEIVFLPATQPDQVKDQAVYKRFESYRDQGMVKFLGLTCHDNVPAVMQAGLETGWYDILMPNYQPASAHLIDPIMEKAAEQGIGGMIMKSWKGVPDDAGIRSAVWANMLNKPYWTTICKTVEHEGFVDVVGGYAHTWRDHIAKGVDGAVAEAGLGHVCTACGHCTSVCPEGLSPARIFRYEMYAAEYGWWDHGRGKYASLPETQMAGACTDCGACVAGCQGRLNIPERLREAHRVLA